MAFKAIYGDIYVVNAGNIRGDYHTEIIGSRAECEMVARVRNKEYDAEHFKVGKRKGWRVSAGSVAGKKIASVYCSSRREAEIIAEKLNMKALEAKQLRAESKGPRTPRPAAKSKSAGGVRLF